MTITDEIKKLLTIEVLGECWHERRTEDVGKKPWDLSHCVKCGELVKLQSFDRRTFNNRNDLLDLYEAVYEDGKWVKLNTLIYLREAVGDIMQIEEYVPWLFCLNGEGYEDRCKMVAEFYGWEEGK